MTKFIAMTVINFVTPKAEAKNELLFNKLGSEVGLLNIQVPQQSVTKIISVTIVDLITPKAGAFSMSFCSTNWAQASAAEVGLLNIKAQLK